MLLSSSSMPATASRHRIPISRARFTKTPKASSSSSINGTSRRSSAAPLVQEAVRRHNPTVFRGKVAKVYYATQTQVNPPTFVFFVNDPQAVHFSYERYLENQLRTAFGFKGTGIRLHFRARSKIERVR